MSRVLFTVWFSIQGIIQNTTCSVWFRIQSIIKKCPGYYSTSGSLFRVLFKIRPAASGSVFRVLFKIRPAASCSGFRVLLKNVQDIIQRMVQYSGYYSKYDLQRQRIIQNYPGYYSTSSSLLRVLFKIRPAASGSVFMLLFKIRPAASGSGFRVLLKNVQGII